MFFYLYDAVVLDKKYATLLDRIESRVIELGINGRIERLTPLRNIKELIDRGIKNGAHTIVVLGTDQTFLRALQVTAQYDVAVGFLPFGSSALGPLFGVSDPMDGCNALSRRITKQLALGKANQTYFLTEVTAELPRGTKITCDGQWSITTQTDTTTLALGNIGHILGGGIETPTIYDTHQLHLLLQPHSQPTGFLRKQVQNHATSVRVNKVTVEHPDVTVPILLDQTTVLKTPVSFSLKAKAIKVIVGKQRLL
ncbi:MAG: hypothetical protein HY565_01825 [Candidatus Kerfeldbacteria bacterium]|nr:hypothetical protein [Candidatus Kerfeldbacteria bacterium]